MTQAAENPRKDLTLSIYRRDGCGTAAEIGVITQDITYGYSGTTPFYYSFTTTATSLRPLERTLMKSGSQYATRYLRCVDGKLSVLADFASQSQIPQPTVESLYGTPEKQCCALDPSSSPMLRDGTINPGGTESSSNGGSGNPNSQYATEVFWCVANCALGLLLGGAARASADWLRAPLTPLLLPHLSAGASTMSRCAASPTRPISSRAARRRASTQPPRSPPPSIRPILPRGSSRPPLKSAPTAPTRRR